jgi:hypothetical protein
MRGSIVTLRLRSCRTFSLALASADDGYLLYGRENTLMAQLFDAAHARKTGDSVPPAAEVDYFAGVAQSQFAASANGICDCVRIGQTSNNTEVSK